jgi:hypothetical protein
LGHFCDNHVSDVIVLKGIILMTGLPMFAVSNRSIIDSVLVSLIIELECFFAKSLLSKYKSVLITVRVEMDDSQSTIDFDHLSPIGLSARFIKLNGFELVRESVLLNQFIGT